MTSTTRSSDKEPRKKKTGCLIRKERQPVFFDHGTERKGITLLLRNHSP